LRMLLGISVNGNRLWDNKRIRDKENENGRGLIAAPEPR
jgi:hypothetical protein